MLSFFWQTAIGAAAAIADGLVTAVVLGRSDNGRQEWKLKDASVSYGSWQFRSIEQTV